MAHRTNQTVRLKLGGTAVVCCVHDREKRVVVAESEVVALGVTVGQLFNPKQHKIHLCACCENLFVDTTDIPKFCVRCRQRPIHLLHGPLPEPKGVV